MDKFEVGDKVKIDINVVDRYGDSDSYSCISKSYIYSLIRTYDTFTIKHITNTFACQLEESSKGFLFPYKCLVPVNEVDEDRINIHNAF